MSGFCEVWRTAEVASEAVSQLFLAAVLDVVSKASAEHAGFVRVGGI